MLSKVDRQPKRRDAVEEAWEYVAKLSKDFTCDVGVTHLHVGTQRKLLTSCRRILEHCQGNLSWTKRPAYWPEDLSFKDPNNDKKNQDLRKPVKFLFDKVKDRLLSSKVSDSSVKSSHQLGNSSKQPCDWTVKDQYIRIKDQLSSSSQINDQLKEKLLGIVETWLLSEKFLDDAGHLERLIDSLKLALSKKLQQLAELYRKQLLAFADKRTSVLSSSSPSLSASTCRGEQGRGSFDSDVCLGEKPGESKSDMLQTGCGRNDTQHSTQESGLINTELSVELSLQEDREEQIIASTAVECVNDLGLDFNCDYSFGSMGVANNTSMLLNADENDEELELCHGSQEETDGCEAAQKLLDEVLESCLEKPQESDDVVEVRKAVQNIFEEEFKTFRELPEVLEVPQVPPEAHFIQIGDVQVHQENFDTLKQDKPLDDVIIRAVLGLMKRDYPDVEVFPILNYDRRGECDGSAWHRLASEKAEWRRLLLVPVLYDRHWLLLAGDNQKKQFCILDSAPNGQRASELAKWFKDLLFRYTGSRSGEWEKIDLPCGKQEDDSSCGYFLLMNAEAFISGRSPNLFRQCLVFDFRKWLIAKLELANASESNFKHLRGQVAPKESVLYL